MDSPLCGLIHWPLNASLGLNAPLSIFVHHLAFKGDVPCVLIGGLPWFPFPRAWEIASLREFSSWLVIAGNALF